MLDSSRLRLTGNLDDLNEEQKRELVQDVLVVLTNDDIEKVGFRPSEYKNYKELNQELARRFQENDDRFKEFVKREEEKLNGLKGYEWAEEESFIRRLKENWDSGYNRNEIIRKLKAKIEREFVGKRTRRQLAFIDVDNWNVVLRDKPRRGEEIPHNLIPLRGIEYSPSKLAADPSPEERGNFYFVADRIAHMCAIGYRYGNVERLDPSTEDDLYLKKKLFRMEIITAIGFRLGIYVVECGDGPGVYDFGIRIPINNKEDKGEMRKWFEYVAKCVQEGLRISKKKRN